MGTHPIFESDFDCLTDKLKWVKERKPVTNTNFSSTTKKREPFWVVLEDHGLKSLCSISLTSHSRDTREIFAAGTFSSSMRGPTSGIMVLHFNPLVWSQFARVSMFWGDVITSTCLPILTSVQKSNNPSSSKCLSISASCSSFTSTLSTW